MNNKILLTLICATVLLVFPITVRAQFQFTTNSDGSLNIFRYTGPGGAAIIPDTTNGVPIVSILMTAFASGSGHPVTSISIGNNVTNIGNSAFAGDSSLTNLIIGTNVSSIGNSAFAGCSELGNVAIPDSITNLGTYAFYTCWSLGSATIGNGVTIIGANSFQNCYALTNLTIGTNVTSIGGNAFGYDTNLTNVTIPDSVLSVGDIFFNCTSLANVVIGNGLTNLANNMFANCISLTNVYFAGNAPSLGSYVFAGVNTNAIVYYLPGTTGWSAFSTNTSLKTALWLPQVQTANDSFGPQTNSFGFDINWASGQTVVVDACTNLFQPVWVPLQTNLLTSGSVYFSDPQWTNYPGRFYRLRSP